MLISDILSKINHLEFVGDASTVIKNLVKLEDMHDSGDLAWCSDKNMNMLSEVSSGTIICSENARNINPANGCNYIVVDNPRLAFKNVIQEFFIEKTRVHKIEESARIHPNANISVNVTIGHNVVIEDKVSIGEHTVIGHNTVILKNTIIGGHVTIGNNNTIGGVGFGYEKNAEGSYELLPHLGNVVIEDGVEIGNNTAIDRAVLGSTFLRKNCKIDNLVHIAHGVEVGENSLIIANSMIGGSTKIGKNVWVAPSASILNKKNIEDNALIGMGAVVIKDVSHGDVIIGNPGKKLNK
jgi:UDP-3-O-[3-hydroxymyristoyl] glucosamine N-acyltransferase